MLKSLISYFLLSQPVWAMQVQTYCIDCPERSPLLLKENLTERYKDIIHFLNEMQDLATKAAEEVLTEQDRVKLNLHYTSYFKNLDLATKYIASIYCQKPDQTIPPYWFSLITHQIIFTTAKGASTTLDFNVLDINQLGLIGTNILTLSEALQTQSLIKNALEAVTFSETMLTASLRTLDYFLKLYPPRLRKA